MSDVVKNVIYIANYKPQDRQTLGVARGTLFEEGRAPASTLVGVQSLATDQFKVEIDAVAIVAEEGAPAGVLEKRYINPLDAFTQQSDLLAQILELQGQA